MQSAFIEDGYTRRSKIVGRPGMYPDITFSWRQSGTIQQARYNQLMKTSQTSEQEQMIGAEFLAQQVLEWDIKDKMGQVAKIDRATILKLHPACFNRLYAIVINMTQLPDEDLDGEWLGPTVEAAADGVTLREHLQGN